MVAPLISPLRRTRPASLRPEPLQPGDNLRGAGLMTLSMMGFGCNDAIVKFVTQEMPLYQAITLRGSFVMLALVLLAQRSGGLRLRIAPDARWPMVLRLIGEVGSTLLFLNALQRMAIGDLTAVMQSLPLVVMLGAALFFGESLGWRRIVAVMVGMVGVLVILRPGSGTFGIWSLAALGAMAMVALRDLSTRRFSRDITSATIAFYAAVMVMLTGLVLSLGQGWILPTVSQILLLVLSSLFLTVGYISAVSAMRIGEISAVAPFRYTSLLWAIVLGMLIFGDWPDLWTWVGSGLVVGAGIYTIWREAQLGRRR
ncbi:DMT family transporter [Paracoccus liaowanqingii]|uniref:DMT family transporter n=1 Tax=Paracoccus liaowanqingii TaxID=2560053 RepID=A0A4P7HI81_9RHOB|nr:DMT family transporter [Paracoccus liaowanqingii]QBX33775.1 DMT family transporter [Paracoccus liaowanqingii]